MTISSRVGPFAQVAAAIRSALACYFPCCFSASNTEDIPVTNTGDVERRPSHPGSAGGAGGAEGAEGESPVLSQLGAYINEGFQEAEEDAQSLGQSSDLAMSSQASSPTASRVSTPEPSRPEPLILPQVATLLGTGAGTETSSETTDDTDTSSAEEEDTSSQDQGSEPTSAVTQEPSTSAVTTPTPAPRKPMGQARTPSPPPPVRSGSLSPKPSTSAEVTLPPPEPKEERLFSVRSRPKIPGEGAGGSGSRVQQQTIFAVTTDQKIIRKRKDQGEPVKPMGVVMKAKVELGLEKERQLLPAKPSLRGDVKEKIALFEPKPAKGEAADDTKSETRSSGRSKKSA